MGHSGGGGGHSNINRPARGLGRVPAAGHGGVRPARNRGPGCAFGILIAAFGVGCVIGGFLQDRNGPRRAALWGTAPALRRVLCGGPPARGTQAAWFWVLFSVPAGLGTAFLYPSIQSCAQKWYARAAKGLATGVIGGAVGLSGAFLTGLCPDGIAGLWPGAGHPGRVLGAGGAHPARLPRGQCPADRPAAGKAPAQRAGQRERRPRGWTFPQGRCSAHRQYWLCAGAVCCSTPAVLLFSPIILKLGDGAGAGRETPRCGAWCWAAWAVRPGRLLMPMLSDRIGRRPTDMILFARVAGAFGGLLVCTGVGRGGCVRGAHLLLLGAGGGAARPLHRPVRLAPCRGELRLSGAGTERGQPGVSVCGESLGAGQPGGTGWPWRARRRALPPSGR